MLERVVIRRMMDFGVAGLLVALMLTPVGLEGGQGADESVEIDVPSGLQTYLDARRLEVTGRYREAIDAYAAAMKQAPEVDEIRIAYGSLLMMVGLPDSAVELLVGRSELDWYGKRVLALSLAQASTRRTDLLEPAREALEEALSERGDDVNLQFSLARILQELGELVEAERVAAELRETRSGSVRVQLFHAQLLAELGRSREAAELFAECAEGPRADELCREGLLNALIASGMPGEAGEMLISWLEPDDLDRMMQAAALLSDGGRSAQALDVVGRVLANAQDSPRARVLEALLLADLGRYDEALPRLESLLKKNRNDVDLLMATSWSTYAAGAGDLDQARQYLDRAWEQVSSDAASPRAVQVTLNAARLELAAGHPSAAREWLERIGDLDVGGAQMLALLAESYKANQSWESGAAALLRLQPTLPERLRPIAVAFEAELRYLGGSSKALRRLDGLLSSSRLPDVFVALQVLQSLELWQNTAEATEAALQRFPDERGLMFAQAVALERLGRVDEAAGVFFTLLEHDPEDVNVANYLGYMWADAGENLDQAYELISRAVEVDPENPAYLDSLGWVDFRLGRLDEAQRWLRRAIELGGGQDGTVLAHLGEVLLALGMNDEARELLRASLDLGCEHPGLVEELLADLDSDDGDPSNDG